MHANLAGRSLASPIERPSVAARNLARNFPNMEQETGEGRRPADRRQYQKAYRVGYKSRAKRVSLTFTVAEYAAIRARAEAD